MYCINKLRIDHELDELVEEALRLPINAWLKGDKVEVRAFYQECLTGDVPAIIRPATDVEVSGLGYDVIITVSSMETVTYSHKDMLVLVSDLLNTIELGYNGRDDAPVIFIRQNEHRFNPKVVKYFGKQNKVYAHIFAALDSNGSEDRYCNTDEDVSPETMSLSQRITSEPAEDEEPFAGLFQRL